MDTINYRYVGTSKDGLLIFQDLEYPSDAPQSNPDDDTLRNCASTDPLIDGDKFFAITKRHAEVRGFLYLALES
jgi:hypothetical protein